MALGTRGQRLDGVFRLEPPPVSSARFNVVLARIVAEWLSTQPGSLAVLAANDDIASKYYRALRDLGGDFTSLQAIVGVDDLHPHWAKFSMGPTAPPLTSIRLNYAGVGETCARLLYEAVSGREYAPGGLRFVNGATLVRRESSGGFSCDDPLVARLARLAANAVERGEAPGTLALQGRFSVPRRLMAERFRKHTGRSLREFTLLPRLRRATDSTISEIAQQCGFNKHADLTERFGQYMGCTPSEYRARCLRPTATQRPTNTE